VWKDNLELNYRIDAEYIIGHSAGANYALFNWRNNRNSKLILVGPVIPQRNIFTWTYRMVKFWIFEWTTVSKERMSGFRHFSSSISKIVKLLRTDLMPIILEIPRENLTIIRGKNDKFLFDQKSADELRVKGIEIIEIEGVGHNWHEKIREEIDKIIN
jgi:pimeloyl-ACP methyl ester carboxylesterase